MLNNFRLIEIRNSLKAILQEVKNENTSLSTLFNSLESADDLYDRSYDLIEKIMSENTCNYSRKELYLLKKEIRGYYSLDFLLENIYKAILLNPNCSRKLILKTIKTSTNILIADKLIEIAKQNRFFDRFVLEDPDFEQELLFAPIPF